MQEGKRHVTGPMEDYGWRGSWSGNERDVLFLNPKGPRFLETAYSLGVDFDDDGRAVVPIDFDGDGDLDLAIHGLQQLRLLENRMPARHFARVRLEETKGERYALGAIVRVEAGGVVQQDYVKATAGFAAQVPFDLHFGLGDAAKIDKLSVTWRDGTREEFRDLPADRLLQIRRGSTSPQVSELKRWSDDTRPRGLARFSLNVDAARLDGSRGRLVEGSGPVVVNFWSPSCAPCATELPELKALSERVRIVGVSTERKDLESVLATVKEHGLTYPQFVADDALMTSFFGSGGEAGIPSTFVFDAEGRLRRAFRRPVTRAEIEAVVGAFGRGYFHVDYLIDGLGEEAVGDLAEAARKIERAIQEKPDYAFGYFRLGLVRQAQRRLDDAIAAFRRSLDLAPEYAKAHHNLGMTLFEGANYADAEKALRAAVTLQDGAVSREMLARALLHLNRHAEAEQEAQTALKLEPRYVNALLTLAGVYDETGRAGEANKLLERALEVDPKRDDIRKILQARR